MSDSTDRVTLSCIVSSKVLERIYPGKTYQQIIKILQGIQKGIRAEQQVITKKTMIYKHCNNCFYQEEGSDSLACRTCRGEKDGSFSHHMPKEREREEGVSL